MPELRTPVLVHYPDPGGTDARTLPWVLALLRGETPRLPPGAHVNGFVQGVLCASRHHGTGGLLHQALVHAGWRDCPAELRTALRDQARRAAVTALMQETELQRVLPALAAQGVQPLLLKGTPLAYTHYPTPALRPRADVDLLIPPDHFERAAAALEALGYHRLNAIQGKLVSRQNTFLRFGDRGVQHVLDVHWKISNAPMFVDTLVYAEMLARARPILELGEHARAPAAPHALLLACVHRVAHHRDTERLIWLYDIHLLARGLSPGEWSFFLDLATVRKVRAICIDALRLARDCFSTPLPASVLASADKGTATESSARYLTLTRARGLRYLLLDLQALAGWRAKLRLLREHAVPTPDYMLRRYGVTRKALLPALYLHRGVRGLRRLLRRP